MARRTLLLIASVLTAALGTALIWLYVQGAESRVREEAALVPVLFLNRPAEAGTAATALGLTTKSVPRDVAVSALTNLQDVAQLRLAVRGVAGQILVREMFAAAPASGLPRGRGAISISIADPNRVPLQLQPGHRVAVYATGGRGAEGVLVVDSIVVLSIGSAAQAPPPAAAGGAQAAVPATIVAFDADPDQAAALVRMVAGGQQPLLYDLGEGTTPKRP